MKLLIVDDEELTRQGLRTALNWEELGITEILEADDGMHGLSIALAEHPDIILCDVRMPRMDGITMLERIRSHFSDISIIFMSGYSDKEYLKAAIQLNAVTYIEKPIEPEEIRQAMLRSIAQCRETRRLQNVEKVHIGYAASQLAYALTMPYSTNRSTVDELFFQFHQYYGTDKFKYLTTFIVKLERIPEHTMDCSDLCEQLKQYLRPMHLHVIYSEKRLFHIIYHIYGALLPAPNTLTVIAEKLHDLFAPWGSHYIAVGETASGLEHAYHSYESAVILLQNSFFFTPGSILTSAKIQTCAPISMDALPAAVSTYKNALSETNRDATTAALAQLSSICTEASDFLPNQIKTIYYELFSNLFQERKAKKLLSDFPLENVLEMMEHCFSFSTLHEILAEKTDAFFHDLESARPENVIIYRIRDYINQNYKNPSLSVKDISDYANLSVSYACTYFKSETGTTLNQYITEFRMEKAKQLLADPRYKINNISAAVGYNDGNYFGKSFRKYSGLSPSEYREKVLK